MSFSVVRPRPASDRRLTGVLMGVTMVAGVVSSLGAPLIPSVARTMHVSLDSAQWSLTVALLMACVAAPIMGRLGDGPRRRPTMLGGLLIVMLGSLVAGVAGSLPILIVGRAMQGCGMGLAPVAMAAAREHLPREKAASVISVLSVCGAAAIGAGYPVSGLLDSALGLHSAYLFGAVATAVAMIAAALVIPDSADTSHGRLDVPGAAALTLGLVALLIAIGEGQQWGWDGVETLVLFAVAIVALVGWARWQLAAEHPLVDLRQLRHRAVFTADLAAIVLGVTLYMYLTLVTEFLQEPHSTGYGPGASTLVAGVSLVPFSLVSLAASRSLPWVLRHLSQKTVLVAGSLMIAAAGAFFALWHGGLWEALVAMGVTGAGYGYTYAAIPGLITRAVPAHETGSATGLYQVVRYVGFSLGSALSAALLAGDTIRHGTLVLERGYVLAMWIGAGICVVSAALSWWLSRRAPAPPAPGALDREQREALAVEEGELAAAGLVGPEGD